MLIICEEPQTATQANRPGQEIRYEDQVRLGVFVIMVYRPPSYSSEENNHLSQLFSNFSVEWELILIGGFNLPSINWDNVHLLQDKKDVENVEPTTQAFIDTFVLSGLSQWVTKSTFLRSGKILDLVFTSAIDRIGDMNIHCLLSHCQQYPIVFDYIYDFSYELTPNFFFLIYLGEEENIKKIDIALEVVNWDFELSDMSTSFYHVSFC